MVGRCDLRVGPRLRPVRRRQPSSACQAPARSCVSLRTNGCAGKRRRRAWRCYAALPPRRFCRCAPSLCANGHHSLRYARLPTPGAHSCAQGGAGGARSRIAHGRLKCLPLRLWRRRARSSQLHAPAPQAAPPPAHTVSPSASRAPLRHPVVRTGALLTRIESRVVEERVFPRAKEAERRTSAQVFAAQSGASAAIRALPLLGAHRHPKRAGCATPRRLGRRLRCARTPKADAGRRLFFSCGHSEGAFSRGAGRGSQQMAVGKVQGVPRAPSAARSRRGGRRKARRARTVRAGARRRRPRPRGGARARGARRAAQRRDCHEGHAQGGVRTRRHRAGGARSPRVCPPKFRPVDYYFFLFFTSFATPCWQPRTHVRV